MNSVSHYGSQQGTSESREHTDLTKIIPPSSSLCRQAKSLSVLLSAVLFKINTHKIVWKQISDKMF